MLGLARSKHPRLGGNDMLNFQFALTGCIAMLSSPYRAKDFERYTGTPRAVTRDLACILFYLFPLSFHFLFWQGWRPGRS